MCIGGLRCFGQVAHATMERRLRRTRIFNGNVVELLERIFSNEKMCIKVEMIYGNGTAACVRNRGFELAETEWVIYVDDDIIIPDALLEINEAITCNGDGFYAAGYFLFDDKGR